MPHVVGGFGADAARLPVYVRMAEEADVAALEPGELGEALASSGALLLTSGLLVALGCPICLSNAVVAAGFAVAAVPILVAIDAEEHAQLRRVEAALDAANLPGRTQERLVSLRPEAPATGPAGAELLVLGYGFADAESHGACFFLDARLRALGREEQILLGPWRRSDDAPAPHCASRAALAAKGGALAARVVDESAEILAGLVRARLAEAR